MEHTKSDDVGVLSQVDSERGRDDALAETDYTQHWIGGVIRSVEAGSAAMFTSLPDSTFYDRLRIEAFLSRQSNDVNQLLGSDGWEVRDFIFTCTEFVGDGGELVKTPKVTLISPTGDCICVIAAIWCRQFMAMVRRLGVPPWERPIKVAADLQQGHGANRYYSLRVVA